MSEPETLSVLCLAGNPGLEQRLRNMLDATSIDIEVAGYDASGLFDHLRGNSTDLLMIHDSPATLDAAALCKAVRTSPQSPEQTMPVVILAANTTIARTIEISNAGPNEVLFFPFSAERLMDRILAAIDDDREFIRVESYVGPDRRAVRDEHYEGPLRRIGELDLPQDRKLSESAT